MAGSKATTWSSQIALITGAGSGLGRELARMLAADGLAIAAVDIRIEGLQSLATELSANAKVAWDVADVTDATALQQAARKLEARLGPIDLLIANAGIGLETLGQAFDPAVFADVIRVNLIGVSNSIAAVLPGMLARGRGHLVAISSLASYRGLPQMAGYCASKSGVNALIEALRVEIEPCGICTTIVCPGWIRTPMTDRLKLQLTGMLEVDDAARRIVRALRKRRRFLAFPAGTRRQVAWLRRLPIALSDWLLRRLARQQLKRLEHTD
jgi:short-subunit dehydrogenase